MPTRRSAQEDRSIGGFLSNLAGGFGDIASGLGQAGGQLLTDPGEFLTETVPQMPGAIAQDLGQRYGMLLPGGRPAGEIGQELYEQPASYLLDALDVAGGGALAVKGGAMAGRAAARGARGAKGALSSFLDAPLQQLPEAPVAPSGGGYAGSLSDEIQSLLGPAADEARKSGMAHPVVDDVAPAAPQAQFLQRPNTRREQLQQFMQPRREMVGSEAGAISFEPRRGRFVDETSGEAAPMPGTVRGGMEDVTAQVRAQVEQGVNRIAQDFQQSHSRILFEDGKDAADGFLANRDAFFKAHPAAAEVQRLRESERAMSANLMGDVGMQQAWNMRQFGEANPYGGRAGMGSSGGAVEGISTTGLADEAGQVVPGESGILEPGYRTEGVTAEPAPSRIKPNPLTERMYGGQDPSQVRQMPEQGQMLAREQLDRIGPAGTPNIGMGARTMDQAEDVLRTGERLERSNIERRMAPSPEETVPLRPRAGSPQAELQGAGGRLAGQVNRQETAAAAQEYVPSVHIDGAEGPLRAYSDTQLQALEQEGVNAYFDEFRGGNVINAESLLEDARMARMVLDERKGLGATANPLKPDISQDIYDPNRGIAEAPMGLLPEADVRGAYRQGQQFRSQLDDASRERVDIADQRRYAEDVLKATGRTPSQRSSRRTIREEARRPAEQVRRRTEQEKATPAEPASDVEAAAQVLRGMGWDEDRVAAAIPGYAKKPAESAATRTEKPKPTESKRRTVQEKAGRRADVDELSDAKLQKKIDYWKGQDRDDAYTKALEAEQARRGSTSQKAANVTAEAAPKPSAPNSGKLPATNKLTSARKRLRERNGANPSANEIASDLGISDKATIRKIRQWLKDQPRSV